METYRRPFIVPQYLQIPQQNFYFFYLFILFFILMFIKDNVGGGRGG